MLASSSSKRGVRRGQRVLAIGAFAVLAAVPAIPRPALAQQLEPVDEARAMQLFDDAAQRFREGRFREAIELLDEAGRLEPSAILRYNKARAYEGLGDEASAIVEYEAYLEMDPEAHDRGAVERRVATLRAAIAERERLQRERAQAAARARMQERPAVESRPSPVPWIIAGAGLAGIGVGTYLGLRARGEERDGNEAQHQNVAERHRSRADSYATGSNIAFVAGGALFVGGTLWGVLDL